MKPSEITTLIEEWDFHNRRHHCWYEESDDAGTGICPSQYATLGGYLRSKGFPAEYKSPQIFGRSLNTPNLRSSFKQTEYPVDSETHTHWAGKETKVRVRLDYGNVGETVYCERADVDLVFRDTLQEGVEEAVENEQTEPVPGHPHYYLWHLDRLEKKVEELTARVEELENPEHEVNYNLVINPTFTAQFAEQLGEAVDKALKNQHHRENVRRSGLY